MQKIRVSENKDYTREFPGKLMTRIEVTTRGGEHVSGLASYPKGHAKNPMSNDDVNSKFSAVCQGLVDTPQRDALLKTLWSMDQAADLNGMFDLLVLK